jgi:hypothetical protein
MYLSALHSNSEASLSASTNCAPRVGPKYPAGLPRPGRNSPRAFLHFVNSSCSFRVVGRLQVLHCVSCILNCRASRYMRSHSAEHVSRLKSRPDPTLRRFGTLLAHTEQFGANSAKPCGTSGPVKSSISFFTL